jgi:hypothetical protein
MGWRCRGITEERRRKDVLVLVGVRECSIAILELAKDERGVA